MVKGDIYTVAGTGRAGFSGDGGPAASAQVNDLGGVGVDAGGDLLIADYGNDRLRLVAGYSCSTGCPDGLASMTKGDIYTVAGNGTTGFSGDGGPATSAELDNPADVAVDDGGDLLISDSGQRLRQQQRPGPARGRLVVLDQLPVRAGVDGQGRHLHGRRQRRRRVRGGRRPSDKRTARLPRERDR
jgi:hypothetical protein